MGKKKDGDHPILSEMEIAELRELFYAYGGNKKGILEVADLMALLRSIGEDDPSEAMALKMIEKVDEDGNHMIDFAEFMAVIASTLDSVDETAELQQAFNVCDADRDGYLSHEDILRMSNLMNLGLTEDDVMEIIKESDRDRDFHISVEEFTKLMRGDGV